MLNVNSTELEGLLKEYFITEARQTVALEGIASQLGKIYDNLYTKKDADEHKKYVEDLYQRAVSTFDQQKKLFDEIKTNIDALKSQCTESDSRSKGYFQIVQDVVQQQKNGINHKRKMEMAKMEINGKLLGIIAAGLLGASGLIYAIIDLLSKAV